jgi:hypothetical protein
MPRVLSLFLIVILASFAPSARASRGSGHSHGHRSASRSKSVHVRSYTRKDGTFVAAHNRAASGSRLYSAPYRRNHMARGFHADASVRLDRHGRIRRSAAAKDAFKREHPCPSNGHTRGSCPGYVIDHVQPLECGGADAPSNMQWQTVADGKAKDRTERSCRL